MVDEKDVTDEEVSRVMGALGRRGGPKGGRARQAQLSLSQRRSLTRKAGRASWAGLTKAERSARAKRAAATRAEKKKGT
jgi:hypothetical protein